MVLTAHYYTILEVCRPRQPRLDVPGALHHRKRRFRERDVQGNRKEANEANENTLFGQDHSQHHRRADRVYKQKEAEGFIRLNVLRLRIGNKAAKAK